MSRQLARVVGPGATFSAPYAHVTERSIFVRGRLDLSFGVQVELRLVDVVVSATVAFVSKNPPGAVLVFEPTPAVLEARTGVEDETWRDEDVTGTHEGGEAALLAKLMARAEAKSETSEIADPEDPTNTGTPAVEPEGDDSGSVTVQGPESSDSSESSEPDGMAREGVQQAAQPPAPNSQTRLRATTHVVAKDESE